MILVDKELQTFLLNGDTDAPGKTAIFGGDESCVTNIGYDLRANAFYRGGKREDCCDLAPGESVFVESREIVQFDAVTVGRVFLKNSRIRMGFTLDAPVYQPGHKTRIYFRVTNVSSDSLHVSAGDKYAMLLFEQLHDAPAASYSGAFQDEFDFKGLGDYKSMYLSQIQSLQGKVKDIRDMEKGIYGNVVTILTIFVTIFTILNVNIELARAAATVSAFLNFNLAVLGGISFLSLFLSELVGREKRWSRALWLIPIVCFAAILILNLLS